MSNVLKSYAEHHEDLVRGYELAEPEIDLEGIQFIEAMALSLGYKKIGGEYFSPEYMEQNQ